MQRNIIRNAAAAWLIGLPAACGTAPETGREASRMPEAAQSEAAETLLLEAVDNADGQPADAADGKASDAGVVGACDLSGPWLLELSIPVRWQENTQLKKGAGRVRLRATTTRKAAGNLLVDGLTPCAMALPTTERKTGAKLRTKFAKRAFAKGAHTITPALTSIRDNQPAARFRMQPFALQYGAVIPNPTMAVWPEDILNNAVDVDNDGHPGVSVALASPEQALARDPVTKLYVAWRVVVRTAGGTIKTCDKLQGLGVVPTLGQELAVNVSVMGCAKRSGTECTAAEVDMAAAFVPSYLKDGNVKLTVTRAAQDTPGVCAAF